MPHGRPIHIRIYDTPDVADRYTIVFHGRYQKRKPGDPWIQYYLGLDYFGHGSRGEQKTGADLREGRWPVAIGKSCHLGTRIEFEDLPKACQNVVCSHYREIWNL